MSRAVRIAVVLSLLALAGCGGAQSGSGAGGPDRLAPTNLYPLAEGNVWSYNVVGAEGDVPTLEVRRVVSVQGPRVRVQSWGGEEVRFETRPQGIYRPGYDVWLLKAPIRVGAEWPSASGRTARVVSVDEAIEVPAGRFEGCVRVEERGGEAALAMATVYCPGVGPVYVESGMQAKLTDMAARAVGKLLGYDTGGSMAAE